MFLRECDRKKKSNVPRRNDAIFMMNLRMMCRYVACNVSTSWIMDYVFGVIKYHGVTLRYFWSNLRMICRYVACNVSTSWIMDYVFA